MGNIELPPHATTRDGEIVAMNTRTIQLVTYDQQSCKVTRRNVHAQNWLSKNPVYDPKNLEVLPIKPNEQPPQKYKYVAILNTGLLADDARFQRGNPHSCAVCTQHNVYFVCRKNEKHLLCKHCANMGIHDACPLCSFIVGAKPLNEE
jgi:hypothetical protein